MDWKKIVPIAVILALMFFFRDVLTFENLKNNHEMLTTYVQEHFYLASLLFVGTYIFATALSLPVGVYLSFFGGFLFDQPYSFIYVVIGATLGASLLFLAAKTALHDLLQKKASGYLGKMRSGFEENSASYMLFLRLVPLFPFWLVNLAPALLGVRFFTYFWTTALGIMPGVFVFTQFGKGLGSVFESGETLSIGAVLNSDVRIALVLLGIFVLIPPLVKYVRKRFSSKT